MSFTDEPLSIEDKDPCQRLWDRLMIDDKLHLCWQDRRGGQRNIRARAIEVTKTGILVESEAAITNGTIISLQTKNFTLLGRASVQECTPKGLNYKIGLYMPDLLLRDL